MRQNLLEAMPKETTTSATKKIALRSGGGKDHFTDICSWILYSFISDGEQVFETMLL